MVPRWNTIPHGIGAYEETEEMAVGWGTTGIRRFRLRTNKHFEQVVSKENLPALMTQFKYHRSVYALNSECAVILGHFVTRCESARYYGIQFKYKGLAKRAVIR